MSEKKVTFNDGSVPTDVPPLPLGGIKYPVTPKSQEFQSPNEVTNQLDLIIPNLYLGDISAAYDIDLLKRLDIKRVLTIEDNCINEDVYTHFDMYKYKKLADHQYSNILEVMDDCLEFIDDAIKNETNILVHCFAGKSRSATLVIAYIMSKEKQSLKKTLDQVRKKRFVKPNMGFYKQLELFQTMNWKVDKNSPVFRSFKFENISKQIQLGNAFSRIEKEIKTNALVNDKNNNKVNDESSISYKCKKCRFTLFTEESIVPHIKSYEQNQLNSWKKKLDYYKQLNKSVNNEKNSEEESECKAELYIEPLDWFRDSLEDINGKLNCPKCDSKIGSFDWCGSQCSCNTWVTPAFHISISKVDLCKPIELPNSKLLA